MAEKPSDKVKKEVLKLLDGLDKAEDKVNEISVKVALKVEVYATLWGEENPKSKKTEFLEHCAEVFGKGTTTIQDYLDFAALNKIINESGGLKPLTSIVQKKFPGFNKYRMKTHDILTVYDSPKLIRDYWRRLTIRFGNNFITQLQAKQFDEEIVEINKKERAEIKQKKAEQGK